MALEVLEQAPRLDTLVVPVGGGGLLAGVAVAVKTLRPGVRVIAVEPENAACFLAACVNGGRGEAAVAPTLADGLAVARIGEKTFALAAPLVDDVVTVSEAELATAMRLLACREGVVAEGAGAATVAALLAGKVRGGNVVAVIGGRNVDARVHERVVLSGAGLPVAQPLSRAA
jgi:threonine dehydratase